MPCFHPLTAYRAPPGMQWKNCNMSGLSFDPRCADVPGVQELKLPCGQCTGCRLERSRQWAMRIVFEKELTDSSCFITLTYDDEHLPKGRTLFQEDVTLFIKRLRKWVDKHYCKKIRYFYCGEYGSLTDRPHYHLCLFGCDFSKHREFYKYTKRGDIMFKSEELQSIWGKGFCPFGELTFDSAAYTARYILKKLNGPFAEAHYSGRKAEFICMSRMPGIGAAWLKKFESDIYPKDYVHLPNGMKLRPPKYYDRLYKEFHSDEFMSEEMSSRVKRFLELKERRLDYAQSHADTESRLSQKEEICKVLTKKINERRSLSDVC